MKESKKRKTLVNGNKNFMKSADSNTRVAPINTEKRNRANEMKVQKFGGDQNAT